MPEQVQVYVKTDTDTRFIKVYRYASDFPEFKDVVIPPAVPCFQDIHRIYIFFHEDVWKPTLRSRLHSPRVPVCDRPPCGLNPQSQSLTTQGPTQGCDSRSTKRVSFHDTSGRSKHRHTRKFRQVAGLVSEPVAGLVSEPVAGLVSEPVAGLVSESIL